MSEPQCVECGAPSEHLHHVVPRILGGTFTVPLCFSCHRLVHGASRLDGTIRHSDLIKAGKKAAKLRREEARLKGWTAEEIDDRLLALHRAGWPPQKIARAFNLSGIPTIKPGIYTWTASKISSRLP